MQIPSHSDLLDHACTVRLGKVSLHSMDVDQLLSNSGSELKHIVTVHAEIFSYAHENPAFEAILKRTVNTIDGRIVYLLCSDVEANRGTVEALKSRCPDLIVEGYSPAFCANIQEQTWNEDILRRIANFRPTHLVVCFGPVKQEMWISQHADLLFRFGVRCAYGLGGTLDFVSGRKKRAPKWIQEVGAECLFRFFCEPTRRLGRTAKMFKMPYFALKFHNHEVSHSGASTSSQTGLNTQ